MKTVPPIIKVCPSCGSRAIQLVRRDVAGKRRGQSYRVSGVEFYECPKCGEKVYPPRAMRQMESHSLQPLRARKATA